MGNLFEKLDDGMSSIKELIEEICDDASITQCFPIDAWRGVTIDGKNYQMQIEVKLREI